MFQKLLSKNQQLIFSLVGYKRYCPGHLVEQSLKAIQKKHERLKKMSKRLGDKNRVAKK